MIMRPPCRTSRRQGVAIVEFALVLIVFSVIIVGMLEIGRGMMVKEILSDAARRGSRAGIQSLGSNSAITAEVNKVLTDNKITPSDATIKVMVNDKVADASTAAQNDKVAVAVSVPVAKICWITPHFFPGGSIESETVIMMRQR